MSQNRDEDITLAQLAMDFGLYEGTLHKWLRQADLDASNTSRRAPGLPRDEMSELREPRRRNRLLEQELEVRR